jgi:Fe-S cluster assembly protein SufD
LTSASIAAGPGVDRYRQQLESLNRRYAEPAWLRERRAVAFERFADHGFPTPQHEAWRQTSVARLAGTDFVRPESAGAGDAREPSISHPTGLTAAFVNGRYVGARSAVLPGIEVLGLRSLLEQSPGRLEARLAPTQDAKASPFADLNTALHEDGAVVFVAPGTPVEEPIHLVFNSTGEPGRAISSHPRILIVAGRGSRVRIVETYLGKPGNPYLTNAVSEVRVEAGAEVEHFRVQQESETAFHIGRLAVNVERLGRFTDRSFSVGATLGRLDLDLILAGEGSECTLEGLFYASGDRHAAVYTRVDHAAPRCASRQLYKGVLDGHGRGVFHGLVTVRPGAQKTDAVQNNRNLLLSKDALVSSTPQLEILADDVKCKHGSTTGQLDAEALFYLRSRGIGLAEARGLLTRAFAGELVGRIGEDSVRAAVEAELAARLGGPSTDEAAA